MDRRKCDDVGVEEFDEHFKEKRLRNLAQRYHGGRSWCMSERQALSCQRNEEEENDKRLCLKLYGLEGLDAAEMKGMKRQFRGDEREWLPVFDCCYRRCMKKGTVVWRWRWKRMFFCTDCAELCRQEHRMELKFKSLKLGTTSIWGLNCYKDEDCLWMRTNTKLLADLGLKQDDEAWL